MGRKGESGRCVHTPLVGARLWVCFTVLAASTGTSVRGRINHLDPTTKPYQHIMKYEVMVPQWQTPGRSKRFVSDKEHPAKAEIQVRAEGKELVLQITRNEDLLAPNYAETHYSQTGEPQTSYPDHKGHCFYHGNVKGIEHSSVVLSACKGLRGLIVISSNLSYLMEPIKDSIDQHLIFRAEHLKMGGGSCGTQHGQSEVNWITGFTSHIRPAHHREKRDLLKDMKYVELYLVADYAEFQKHKWDVEKTKLKLKETANYVDKYYRSLNIRIALVHVEVWTHEDKCDVRENPYNTLWSFLKWRRKALATKKHDNAQLVTGITFNGTTIGLAPLMGMCSDYQSGGVNMDHSDSGIGVAATMAHEMGHNFGMSHDSKGCCKASPEDGGCIMAAATGHPFPKVFNKCNEKELQKYLHNGGGMCLFNMPDTKTLYGGQRCGNGYVEEGEECDCGEVEECVNPCCNPSNCKLKANAECAHGVCCDKCKLKMPGTECRRSAGPCDLPEYCSGNSEFCPANFYQMDGASCERGEAYCYNGMCLTYKTQCMLLWGSEARAAPQICFERVNAAGDSYGNCGKDNQGNYRKCETRNAKCGKIQCQSLAQKPLDANAVAIDTTITLDTKKVQCRGTHVYKTPELEGDMLDPGLVMTGTKCGNKDICFEGQCQNASFLAADKCAAKCHNHGICNNNHNCHCQSGWAPPFCNKPGHGGSIDGGSPSPDNSGAIVAGILVPILLLLCGIGIYLFYCYRRRDAICQKGDRNPEPEGKQFCRNNLDQKLNNGHSNPTFQIKNKDDIAKTGPRHSPALPPKPRLPHPVYSPQPVLILPTLKPTSPAPDSHHSSRVPSSATPVARPPPPLRNTAGKPAKPAPPNRPLPVDPIPRTPKGLQRPPKDPPNNSPATQPRLPTNKKALLPPTAQKQLENRINSATNPFIRDYS